VLVLLVLLVDLPVQRRLGCLREHRQHLYRANSCEHRGGLRGAPAAYQLDRERAKTSRYLIDCFPHVREE
jgi:hypothetical protein